MKNLILIIFSLIIFCSCSNKNGQKGNEKTKIKIDQNTQTTIGKKNITNEIAGSAYRKRATGYFVISKSDTSGFMPIFYESQDNGKIGINLNLPYSNNTETYNQRLSEIKLILPKAFEEYNPDSLNGLSIGRLILTGDLAIEITNDYKSKFGDNENILTTDYKGVSDFLLESKLTKDLNKLFEPYSIVVEKVSIEKAFFTSKDELIKFSSLTQDTSMIPNKVLDCMTWIKFKNK